MRSTPRPIVSEGDIGVNIRSFSRSLRAENVSRRTIETYLESVRHLAEFLSTIRIVPRTLPAPPTFGWKQYSEIDQSGCRSS